MASCALNPFTEELISRGIMVLLLGRLVESNAFAIILGFVLNLGVHLYQGSRALRLHALFYVAVILLLYSPFGLTGAFGFHFAGDLVPFLRFRGQFKEWKAYNQTIGLSRSVR